jgi:hypothetical protein
VKDSHMSTAARLELLATLSRTVQEPLRQSLDCLYQDTDSVCMRDTPGSHQLVAEMKQNLNRLYGLYGQGAST